MLPHFIPADALGVLKDILSIVGAAGAAAAAMFGIWLALRRRAESKRQQERQEDIELGSKFARLETQVGHLQDTIDSTERQYIEFRETALRAQKKLVLRTDELRTRSDQYQKTANVGALRQDTQRIDDQLSRLDADFRRHRDTVPDKYLTLASYQNDLIMWTRTFDDLRQNLRDVHQILAKRGAK